MTIRYDEIGEKLVDSWGYTPPEGVTLDDFISKLNVDGKTLCVLTYIAEILQDIRDPSGYKKDRDRFWGYYAAERKKLKTLSCENKRLKAKLAKAK